MKRKLIYVMSAMLLVGGIAGCGSKTKTTEDTKKEVVEEQTTENQMDNTEVDGTEASKEKEETNLDELYTVEDVDGGVAIMQYKAYQENEVIEIPSEIKGKAVVSIGKKDDMCLGFANDYKVKKIVIPDSVKYIGKESFTLCRGLETVEFGMGIEEIGEQAFNSCHSLKEVKFSEGLKKLDLGAFSACFELESVTLPGSLTEIADGNFVGSRKKVVITAPSGSAAEKYTKEIAEETGATFKAQ